MSRLVLETIFHPIQKFRERWLVATRKKTMYDALSVNYDRFVNWQSRLEIEMPFIEQELHKVNARRILDTACGTGRHAIALAQRGYVVAGADLSARMIERAEVNASLTGVEVQFKKAGFSELAKAFDIDSSLKPGLSGMKDRFDALLCLGNSLPHVLTPVDLDLALLNFSTCLRPGGLVLIQNRNFDAVMSRRERWMEPQAHQEDGMEWLFLRFYDFDKPTEFSPDGLITFNIITLQRSGTNPWTQQVTSTFLRPLRQAEMRDALIRAGFHSIESYGNMTGAAFDSKASGNLVITAYRNE